MGDANNEGENAAKATAPFVQAIFEMVLGDKIGDAINNKFGSKKTKIERKSWHP